ncbi:MAG: hypothetical protein ACE5OR_12640 [bacterium]
MRITRQIEVNGNDLNALFDTGAINTYIVRKYASHERIYLDRPFRVGLGGESREIKETCLLKGKIEELEFSTDADIIEDLGTIDGKRIDIIIGARTMERWEIKLDPKTGELDLTGLRRREFTEY